MIDVRFADTIIADAIEAITRAYQSLERLPHETVEVPVVDAEGNRTDGAHTVLHRFPCAVCDIAEALKLATEAIESDGD